MRFTRRSLFASSGVLGGLGLLSMLPGCGRSEPDPTPKPNTVLPERPEFVAPAGPPSDRKNWVRLVQGNARYAAGRTSHQKTPPGLRREQVERQRPYACIVGCIDARVPTEMIFDAGLGELVVVRSPGVALNTTVMGSVEYAVKRFGIRLVVVVGHSGCETVKAAIDVVNGGRVPEGNYGSPVRAVLPAVRLVKETGKDPADKFLENCITTQAVRTASWLRHRAPVLAPLTGTEVPESRRVDVVPVLYDLESGLITRVGPPRL